MNWLIKKLLYIPVFLLLITPVFAADSFSFSYYHLTPTHTENYVLTQVPDTDSVSTAKKINFRKAVWLGVFTGTVGGHLWYIGYKKQALKRTFDGAIAYFFIGIGALAHVLDFKLLTHFATFLLLIGLLMWFIVVFRTVKEISFLSKHKLPPKEKVFKQPPENQQQEEKPGNAQSSKTDNQQEK